MLRLVFIFLSLIPITVQAIDANKLPSQCKGVIKLKNTGGKTLGEAQITSVLSKFARGQIGELSPASFAKELARVAKLRNLDAEFLLAYGQTESTFRSSAISKNNKFILDNGSEVITDCVGIFQICIPGGKNYAEKIKKYKDPVQNLETAGEILGSDNISTAMWDKSVFLNIVNPNFCSAFLKRYKKVKGILEQDSNAKEPGAPPRADVQAPASAPAPAAAQ